MSFAQPSWSPVESTESPMILTLRLSNSGLILAMYPSSVVQTGVKSFGCENSTAQESPIQSWKRIRPSVVSASKSGAVSPICNAIVPSSLLTPKVSASLVIEGRVAKSGLGLRAGAGSSGGFVDRARSWRQGHVFARRPPRDCPPPLTRFRAARSRGTDLSHKRCEGRDRAGSSLVPDPNELHHGQELASMGAL